MDTTGELPKKLFTVQQANAMLPLVRAIVDDLAELSRSVMDRRHRLAHLLAGREMDWHDPYDAELMQIEDELERDAARLHGLVDELRALGVEPKSGPEGLVDFPSLHEGRLVYLCWKLDESEVSYWHEVDAGFVGRQPIAVAVAPGASMGSDRQGPQGSPAATGSSSGIVAGEVTSGEAPLQRGRRPVKFGLGSTDAEH